MLNGRHIAVLGGDARQIEVVKILGERQANVHLAGFDQLQSFSSGMIKTTMEELDAGILDALILPVSGLDFDGSAEAIFSNRKLILTEDWLKQTKQDCLVFTGITTPCLNKYISRSRRQLIALFERDDVAIYNSIPTVEGTLMMIIQNTDITIHQSKTVVLGFGRVGMTLSRTLHMLGAKVTVAVNRPETAARVREMGMTAIYNKGLKSCLSSADICVNTVPSLVLSEDVLKDVPSRLLIIDLASKPGGTDFEYAQKRGIKALLAPGLPGLVAPKTAGRIIAEVLCEIMDEYFRKGENPT